MKLARLEDGVPVGRSPPKRSSNAGTKGQEAEGIEQAKDSPDYQLSSQFPLRAIGNPEERPARSREHQWPNKRPRNGAGEGEVVIVLSQLQTRSLLPRVWDAVSQDIMSCLYVEALLDLGVWCRQERDKDRRGYEERQERV